MRFLRNGDSEPNRLAAGIIYHYGATEGYPSCRKCGMAFNTGQRAVPNNNPH